MLLQTLIEQIEYKYPRFLAESWDNVGLMIGSKSKDIQKILVALEINENVVAEAIEKKADLIVSHHPFFFSKFNQINSDTVKGSLAIQLIQNQIAVYSMHTNYDIALDGMSDAFIRSIGFEPEEIFLPAKAESWYLEANQGKEPGLGRIFTLEHAETLESFARTLKEKLSMPCIRYVGMADARIQRIAVITGSAADMYEDAKTAGADVLISGDMKYHIAHDALDSKMNVIDCGHFETENLFRDSMREFLCSICSLEVLSSCVNLNPFTYL